VFSNLQILRSSLTAGLVLNQTKFCDFWEWPISSGADELLVIVNQAELLIAD
jgi:hypothetical protein